MLVLLVLQVIHLIVQNMKCDEVIAFQLFFGVIFTRTLRTSYDLYQLN